MIHFCWMYCKNYRDATLQPSWCKSKDNPQVSKTSLYALDAISVCMWGILNEAPAQGLQFGNDYYEWTLCHESLDLTWFVF